MTLSMSSIRKCALCLVVVTLPVSLHAQGSNKKKDSNEPPVQGSTVGYIGDAVVGSQVRVRFDAIFGDSIPVRWIQPLSFEPGNPLQRRGWFRRSRRPIGRFRGIQIGGAGFTAAVSYVPVCRDVSVWRSRQGPGYRPLYNCAYAALLPEGCGPLYRGESIWRLTPHRRRHSGVCGGCDRVWRRTELRCVQERQGAVHTCDRVGDLENLRGHVERPHNAAEYEHYQFRGRQQSHQPEIRGPDDHWKEYFLLCWLWSRVDFR
jgi:hypothetical protein